MNLRRTFNEIVAKEIRSYRAEKTLEFFDKNNLVLSPLTWWKSNEKLYPSLAKYARWVLAIPATSASSGRVFSAAGQIVTKKRARLTGDAVTVPSVSVSCPHETVMKLHWTWYNFRPPPVAWTCFTLMSYRSPIDVLSMSYRCPIDSFMILNLVCPICEIIAMGVLMFGDQKRKLVSLWLCQLQSRCRYWLLLLR